VDQIPRPNWLRGFFASQNMRNGGNFTVWNIQVLLENDNRKHLVKGGASTGPGHQRMIEVTVPLMFVRVVAMGVRHILRAVRAARSVAGNGIGVRRMVTGHHVAVGDERVVHHYMIRIENNSNDCEERSAFSHPLDCCRMQEVSQGIRADMPTALHEL
jgi:hypothetical protein